MNKLTGDLFQGILMLNPFKLRQAALSVDLSAMCMNKLYLHTQCQQPVT
jgi:hypothetical protein